MIYLDTSSLLKLLLPEPESVAAQEAVAAENSVIISSLAQLETEVQLRAGQLGGDLTKRQHRQLLERLRAFKESAPFEFRSLPGTVFQVALKQNQKSEHAYMRTLDRLHLAAMEELNAHRLMTHDLAQSEAARAMGYEVVSPGLPSKA